MEDILENVILGPVGSKVTHTHIFENKIVDIMNMSLGTVSNKLIKENCILLCS